MSAWSFKSCCRNVTVYKISARLFMSLTINANVFAQDNNMLKSFLGTDFVLLLNALLEPAHLSRSDLIAESYFVFSRYIPPLLWGKSGHLQTALYGKLGRVSSPHPSGVRKYLPMQDGATSTFDLFEPMGDHRTGGEAFDQDLRLLKQQLILVGC